MPMTWDTLFGIVNLVALIAWIPLVVAPRPPWLCSALRFGVVGGLSALYAALIGTALAGGFGASPGPAPDFSTIAGIRSIFATDGGVVIGWIHYLAFDLMAGLWIAADADRRGMARWVQVVPLVLCFLAGPAGLLLHLCLSRFVRDQSQRGTLAI
ncbi:ABA4-like family protein [Sphingomonas sp. CJ99]